MDTQMAYKDPEAKKEAEKKYREANRAKIQKYREANRERINKYKNEWSRMNSDKRRESCKKYRLKHRDKVKEYKKKYLETNRDKVSEAKKKYRMLNHEKMTKYKNEYNKKRSAHDPHFKLTKNIRRSVLRVLNQKQSKKTNRTHEYLGCSLEFFTTEYWPSKIRGWNNAHPEHKLDLESNDIAIDHIKPVRAFEENEIHDCWHYTNLQPLPKAINNRKRDTWTSADESFWRSNIIHNDEYTAPYLPVDMIKHDLIEPSSTRAHTHAEIISV